MLEKKEINTIINTWLCGQTNINNILTLHLKHH